MANLLDEDLIPFALGIRSLPGRPHISTGYRFISKGSHGVMLETIVVGGRRFTTRQALRRFVANVTAAAQRQHNSAPGSSSAQTINQGGLSKLGLSAQAPTGSL